MRISLGNADLQCTATLSASTAPTSTASRLISAPLYSSLADLQLLRLPEADRPARDTSGPPSRFGQG